VAVRLHVALRPLEQYDVAGLLDRSREGCIAVSGAPLIEGQVERDRARATGAEAVEQPRV
jgi:hypothetical protein